MGLFNKILHAGEGRKLKSLESIAPVVGGHEPEMEARSDDELRALTATWREELDQIDDPDKQQEHLDDILPEAFAAVARNWEPGHFLRRIAPRLKDAGANDDDIDRLLRDNPRRFFAGDPVPAS